MAATERCPRRLITSNLVSRRAQPRKSAPILLSALANTHVTYQGIESSRLERVHVDGQAAAANCRRPARKKLHGSLGQDHQACCLSAAWADLQLITHSIELQSTAGPAPNPNTRLGHRLQFCGAGSTPWEPTPFLLESTPSACAPTP